MRRRRGGAKSKRELAARALERSGLGALLRVRATWHGVLVLNYHRVSAEVNRLCDQGLVSTTPDALDAQLSLLKQQCDIIGPDDLDTVRQRDRDRYLLLTFDDGYRDNYEQAFPVLRTHGVIGTFFLCTGFIDRRQTAWWDEIAWMVRVSPRRSIPAGGWLPAPVEFDEPEREAAVRSLLARYKTLPGERTGAFLDFLAEATGSGRATETALPDSWMTWDMARRMRAAGMCFGGHTVNHPVLATLPRDWQDAEIGGCKERFEAELGEPMRYFAYPVGGAESFNDDTRICLQRHGVEYAFSFYGGYLQAIRVDPYDIPRVHVGPTMSLDRIQAMVTLPQVFA